MLNKAKNKKKNYSLQQSNKTDVEIGHLFGTVEEQIPGYLSVKINDYKVSDDDVKFFGVENKGDDVTGNGVKADKIKNKNKQTILLFNISNLIESGQFTENINQGVIMVDEQELGRDNIETIPSIYLG